MSRSGYLLVLLLFAAGFASHSQAQPQGLKVIVQRAGPAPKVKDSTRKIHLKVELQNASQQKIENLLVLWTLVVDEGDGEDLKFVEGCRVVSRLLPSDTYPFTTAKVTISARGKTPRLKGHAVRVQSGNKIIFSEIDPKPLEKIMAEHDAAIASTKAD